MKDHQKQLRSDLWWNFPDTNFLCLVKNKYNVCYQRTEQYPDKAHPHLCHLSFTSEGFILTF